MWKIVKYCFALVFLAIAIHGNENETPKEEKVSLEKQKENLIIILYQMAQNNESIHNKFQPLKDGLLPTGGYSVMFKGISSSDKEMIVAMKFIALKHLEEAKREFAIYSYLNAVDNPQIERFGIPNVYYYNEWNGYMLTVFSYFDDGDLIDRHWKGHFSRSKGNQCINSLILFREFVRQSKYLHSRGVRHDDIKPENIMLRKHRSFLIDFDLSSKMNEDNGGGTFDYASRKYLNDGRIRTVLDDYESFLYAMCRLNQIELKWFDNPRFKRIDDYSFLIIVLSRMKEEETKKFTSRVNKAIKSAPLKQIFLKFANETFQEDGSFPDYDGLYDAINAEINKFDRPWFTWLKDNQIAEAELELMENPLPDIRTDIADPKEFDFKYDTVNFTRFYE